MGWRPSRRHWKRDECRPAAVRRDEMNIQLIHKVVIAGLLCLLVYWDYRIIDILFEPLAWAAILTTVFYPVHRRLAQRIRSKNLSAAISLLVVVFLVIAPSLLIATVFVQEGRELAGSVPRGRLVNIAQSASNWVSSTLGVPQVELEDKIRETAEILAGALARASANLLGDLVRFVFNFFLAIVAIFYLLRDGPALIGFMRDTSPFDEESTELIISGVASSVTTSFQSNLVTALAQGTLAGIIFWVLGVPSAVFWGVASGVLGFLPLIAPALVWIGAAIYLFVGGMIVQGVLMLLLGNFIISGVDNIIRPAFIAGKSKTHTLVVVFSLFGGILLFGFLGLIIGPLLGAVTMGVLDGYHRSVLQSRSTDSAHS